jgi:hypothetical protein
MKTYHLSFVEFECDLMDHGFYLFKSVIDKHIQVAPMYRIYRCMHEARKIDQKFIDLD